MSALPAFTMRRLAAGDGPLMNALLTLFGEAFDEPETYGRDRPGAAYLGRLLAKDHFIALVAMSGRRSVREMWRRCAPPAD